MIETGPAIIIAAAVTGLSLIVVALINHRCRHSWVNVGEIRRRVIPAELGRDNGWSQFEQQVQCEKCGLNTWQRVG